MEPPYEPEVEGDLCVTFDDVAARTFEDLVAATVAMVRGVPGVSDVRHEDRELILVWGVIDGSALQDAVEQWWRERLATEV